MAYNDTKKAVESPDQTAFSLFKQTETNLIYKTLIEEKLVLFTTPVPDTISLAQLSVFFAAVCRSIFLFLP